MTYNETDIAGRINRLLDERAADPAGAGGPDAPNGPASLDALDQFHLGGAAAVSKVIGSLHLQSGDRVLDVGSGFGGPARQLAREAGVAVVGVDITPGYVQAARELTARAGLADQVTFQCADIAAFADGPFDAAITMHVQMNVEDKRTWFAHIHDRLAPGARLGVWEVCRGIGPQPAWPLPWSIDGSDSYLVDAATLLADISAAGFDVDTWTDETPWATQWLTMTTSNRVGAGPALPMIIDEGYPRVRNFGAALKQASVQIWMGTFVRP